MGKNSGNNFQGHQANPSDYGWQYQGSNAQSRVEFYQHPTNGAKLDYYPTTGTVKTSLDHPTQGKTQMFRRDLDDTGYEQVLQNPRAHTNQGYQTRANQPSSSYSAPQGGYSSGGYYKSQQSSNGYSDGYY
ncbi:hypothetical protein WJX73_001632 [Symbiochloris irregularis]|uniref:Uncharacterized protein n=1 Tax=Symbiochloris irregularis TaxID=706552 RepID=A0AAW1PGK5_9CHLO